MNSGESEELHSIAEAAETLGVTQRTLRFYEDKGLIGPRRVGTTRVYARREMVRMHLILRGKRLGFSIREIAEFLSLYDAEPGIAGQMRHLLGQVNSRLDELRQQRAALDQTISELEAMGNDARAHIQEG